MISSIFSEKQKLSSILIFLIGFLTSLTCYSQVESDFYTPPTLPFNQTKDLAVDYNVDNSFTTNDSNILQQAIDDVSTTGGGNIIIPSGNYTFANVNLKSNVHLEIDSNVVIKPTRLSNPNKSNFIFILSNGGLNPIENVSITGIGGKFTVDLSNLDRLEAIRVVSLKNVTNFLISDFKVIDNYTKFASVVFGVETINVGGGSTVAKGPVDGIMKDVDGLGIADYGYGLVQMQLGNNILFTDLTGIGGITLRLEPHVASLRAVGTYTPLGNITARRIESSIGNSTVMLSPHYINVGYVDIQDVTSHGSGFAVRIENGFTTSTEASLGLTPGSFESTSILRDIKASYSHSEAQLKAKHYSKFMPCDLRPLISTTPINPGGTSFLGPSIAGVVYNSNYTIDFNESEITDIGTPNSSPITTFRPEQIMVVAAEIISQNQCNALGVTNTTKDTINIHPVPVKNSLDIDMTNVKGRKIKIINVNGQIVLKKQIKPSQTNISIDVSSIPKGIYFLNIGNNIVKKIVKE